VQGKREFAPVTKVIEPGSGWALPRLREAWASRDLLWMLSWRNIATRYTQMVLGMAWAALEPMATVLVMVVVFGVIIKLPSQGVPYPLLVLAGFVPYILFSKTLTSGTFSVIEHLGIISKVYFPRIILPLTSALRELFTAIAPVFVLVALMLAYGYPITWRVMLFPFVLIYSFLFGLGLSYWLAAPIVQYRDIGYLLNIFVQLTAYLTPIAYMASLIPEKARWVFAINPLYWIAEFARWSLLGLEVQIIPSFFVSLAITLVVLSGGLFVFARFETNVVDVQ
jgi:lipopolysaccharide transport system permease protein